MSRERRCRCCNEPGHNIRSCIKALDESIILEYSRLNQELPFNLSENKINKLCQKYGLATNHTIISKRVSLHNIYLHLGTIHRLNLLESQPRIYHPTYLPLREREQRILPIYLFDLLQPPPRTPPTPLVIKNKKPSIQIVVNKNKFPQNIDVIEECPVCYEKCNNAIITDCNHSYCQSCISNLIHTINKNTLPCPLCRENIKNLFVFSEKSSDLMLQL